MVLWTLDGTTCGDGSRRGSGGGCETSGPIVLDNPTAAVRPL